MKQNRPKNYDKVHYWLRKKYGTPKYCESKNCKGESNTFDWCLKEGRLHQNKRENYLRLCRKCHVKYDWNEEKEKQWKEKSKLSRSKENILKRSSQLKGRKRPMEVVEKIKKNRPNRAVVVMMRNGLFLQEFKSIIEAARYLNVCSQAVWNVLNGCNKSVKKYQFIYAKKH